MAGYQLWLCSQNIRTIRLSNKLDYKYHSLFIITKCIKTQVYRLKLSLVIQNIQDVFHVSLLDFYHTVDGRAPSLPLLIEVDGKNQAEIEQIHNSQLYY